MADGRCGAGGKGGGGIKLRRRNGVRSLNVEERAMNKKGNLLKAGFGLITGGYPADLPA